MDVAYDHIQEENFPDEDEFRKNENGGDKDNGNGGASGGNAQHRASGSFNTELQDAYRAFSNSPWGARLGGFFGTVRKQGEHYYEEARQEYSAASEQATRGFSDLRETIMNRTRSLSLQQQGASPDDPLAGPPSDDDTTTEKGAASGAAAPSTGVANLPADILHEAENMLSRFRSEAARRLRDIERAEDAADEALLKFGANIRNFLRDAVTIAPPEAGGASGAGAAGGQGAEGGEVLFESKDAEGRRVLHTTRLDASLHAIHASADKFTSDPDSPEFAKWAAGFDVSKQTDAIARDLEKYDELRKTMEALVPEKVEYGAFWTRYYFLRHVVESDEQRRREMLKATAAEPEEEVAWEDSDDESSTPNNTTDQPTIKTPTAATTATGPGPEASQETLKQPSAPPAAAAAGPSDCSGASLKPGAGSPRRSNDQHSSADSDASYDLVSGAPSSRAPSSPKEAGGNGKKEEAVAEESDEDWE
ncbi:hypothetical protein BDY21DRAFT_310090 [Lineolata rhizophorae]|uniref:BSD domain-containing protein n=1 Tax=Lineolata rhizophorae TaxID=578093 RepID=A0A6A6NR95_9PEZI|nr:hypothetical protein BDY21DRAFT_310090 [Lineolata rhizophorae]